MFTKTQSKGFIVFVSQDRGGTEEITKEEYDAIMQKIQSKPQAQKGFTYKLKADTLEWEQVELPPIDDTDDEATTEDYENALKEVGIIEEK